MSVTHSGGCHCGKVRFTAKGDAVIKADRCNCSICYQSGFLHMLIAKDDFTLLQGEEALETYTFGSGIAQHYFCGTCGVKSFYIPRSHPHGVSVNVTCIDPETIEAVEETPFDGRNWEKNVHKLSPISD